MTAPSSQTPPPVIEHDDADLRARAERGELPREVLRSARALVRGHGMAPHAAATLAAKWYGLAPADVDPREVARLVGPPPAAWRVGPLARPSPPRVRAGQEGGS